MTDEEIEETAYRLSLAMVRVCCSEELHKLLVERIKEEIRKEEGAEL